MSTSRKDRPTRIPFALVCLLLSTACARPVARTPFPAAPTAPEGLKVHVVNDYTLDARIYLVRGTTRIPLGTVGSAERRTFRISTAELGHRGDVRLLADPVGEAVPYATDVIQVAPGQRVEWRLAHALNYSSVVVRW